MRTKKLVKTLIKQELKATLLDAEMLIEDCKSDSHTDIAKLNQIQTTIQRLYNRSLTIAELKGQMSMLE